MKFQRIILMILIFVSNSLFAQKLNENLLGSWVKVESTYQSGSPLPENNYRNTSYLRFDFKKNKKVFKTATALNDGVFLSYHKKDEMIQIGILSYKIEKITKDELILIEEGEDGFDESSIKIIFHKENRYQNELPLDEEQLILTNNDTLYRAGKKIRPIFDTEMSFHDFLKSNMPEYKNQTHATGYMMATFVIRKDGSIDDIRIHKTINKKFNEEFVAAVKKSVVFWKPGTLNDAPVDVLYTETFKFISNSRYIRVYHNFNKGVYAVMRKDYNQGAQYFSRALEHDPNEFDVLYQRFLCYSALEQKEKACIDWNFLKLMQGPTMDRLPVHYCD